MMTMTLTMSRRYEAERGQTLPVWVFSVLMALTLMFSVYNYAITVREQIHAQNAADSAAAAAIGNDAAALNSVNTLLSAFDIQDLKVRNIVGAVPQLLLGGDHNCSTLITDTVSTSPCATDLSSAVTNLTSAVTNLTGIVSTLNNFQGNLTDRLTNVPTLVNSLLAPNGSGGCSVNVLTDCDYKYTTKITYGSNGMPTVDEYACKKVPNVAAAFLHINSTYYSIGHTTITLAPIKQVLNPATMGAAVQQTSSLFPSISGTSIIGSIAGLSVSSGTYVPVATTPPTTPQTIAQVCPS
jgi:hypothetical protein